MVGRDDITSHYDEQNENSTYSMRKEKKKANILISEEHTADNEVDKGEYMTLIDNFVQGVIERAKREYLDSCANGDVETRVREVTGEGRLHAGNILRCSEDLTF